MKWRNGVTLHALTKGATMIRRYLYALFSLAIIGIGYEMLPTLDNKIDSYLKKYQFQGSALIAKEGRIVFSKGYGQANLEHGVANTPDTVYRIGSITKLITAVAFIQLQDQGLLSVNDPVSKFLPDYPKGDQITIDHLLSHSSGTPSIYHFSNLKEIQRHHTTPLKATEHFKDLPLKFTPGSSTQTSDSGYILLGAIIENVTGQSFEHYIKKQILEPFQMDATYYDYNHYVIPHRASGYQCKNGVLQNATFIDMSLPHAAGALASTTQDLYRFNKAVRKDPLLSKALFTVRGTNPEQNLTTGYGYRIGPMNRGMEGCAKDIVGHFASIDGFSGALISYLEEDLTIILLSNIEETNLRSLHKEIADLLRSSW